MTFEELVDKYVDKNIVFSLNWYGDEEKTKKTFIDCIREAFYEGRRQGIEEAAMAVETELRKHKQQALEGGFLTTASNLEAARSLAVTAIHELKEDAP